MWIYRLSICFAPGTTWNIAIRCFWLVNVYPFNNVPLIDSLCSLRILYFCHRRNGSRHPGLFLIAMVCINPGKYVMINQSAMLQCQEMKPQERSDTFSNSLSPLSLNMYIIQKVCRKWEKKYKKYSHLKNNYFLSLISFLYLTWRIVD